MLKSDTTVVSQRKTMPKGTHLVIVRVPPPQVSITPTHNITAANYGQTLPPITPVTAVWSVQSLETSLQPLSWQRLTFNKLDLYYSFLIHSCFKITYRHIWFISRLITNTKHTHMCLISFQNHTLVDEALTNVLKAWCSGRMSAQVKQSPWQSLWPEEHKHKSSRVQNGVFMTSSRNTQMKQELRVDTGSSDEGKRRVEG